MAYGFNAQEEQAREKIRGALMYQLPRDDYNLQSFVNDPLTFGLCDKPFKRDRIVKQVKDALSKEGFLIQREATTCSGKYTYVFLEVDGIAIEVGSARRGGQGIFVSTISKMNDAISTSIQQLHKMETERLMKETIKAKLNAEEIAFLKL